MINKEKENMEIMNSMGIETNKEDTKDKYLKIEKNIEMIYKLGDDLR